MNAVYKNISQENHTRRALRTRPGKVTSLIMIAWMFYLNRYLPMRRRHSIPPTKLQSRAQRGRSVDMASILDTLAQGRANTNAR